MTQKALHVAPFRFIQPQPRSCNTVEPVVHNEEETAMTIKSALQVLIFGVLSSCQTDIRATTREIVALPRRRSELAGGAIRRPSAYKSTFAFYFQINTIIEPSDIFSKCIFPI